MSFFTKTVSLRGVALVLWVIGAGYGCAESEIETPSENTNNGTNNRNQNSNNTTTQNNTRPNNSQSNNTMSNNSTGGNNQTCVALDPSIGPCDVLCQTGCGAGEHCVTRQAAEGEPVTAECELQMGAGQGASCQRTGECGEGFSCRNFNGDQACRAYCRTGDDAAPQCPVDHACIPTSEPRIGICVAVNNTCDVVPTDTCPEPGDECYNFPSGRRCEQAGNIALGELCQSTADCAEGTRCVADATDSRCRNVCNPQNPQCPNEGNCAELADQNGQSLGWGACF